jgi:hypothetical protein
MMATVRKPTGLAGRLTNHRGRFILVAVKPYKRSGKYSSSDSWMHARRARQTRLTFSDIELARQLFGEQDGNLKRLADLLGIDVHARGNTVHLNGEDIGRGSFQAGAGTTLRAAQGKIPHLSQ